MVLANIARFCLYEQISPRPILSPSKTALFRLKFHSFKKLKVAICKGFRISRRKKYPKNRGSNFADFSKIKAHLRALYVR